MPISLPEIPEAERTPLVRQLLDIISLQQERIQQLEERVTPGSKGTVHAGPEATQAVEHNRIEHAQSYEAALPSAPKILSVRIRG